MYAVQSKASAHVCFFAKMLLQYVHSAFLDKKCAVWYTVKEIEAYCR